MRTTWLRWTKCWSFIQMKRHSRFVWAICVLFCFCCWKDCAGRFFSCDSTTREVFQKIWDMFFFSHQAWSSTEINHTDIMYMWSASNARWHPVYPYIFIFDGDWSLYLRMAVVRQDVIFSLWEIAYVLNPVIPVISRKMVFILSGLPYIR